MSFRQILLATFFVGILAAPAFAQNSAPANGMNQNPNTSGAYGTGISPNNANGKGPTTP
jgi:hypothetical protein